MLLSALAIFIGHFVIAKTCCATARRDLFEITVRNEIKVFWNIPTFQCDYHKLNFTGLAQKYGIRQNNKDRFTGDLIDILYDPGSFPAIIQDGTTTIFRNGGVPQRGNLTHHLEMFSKVVNETMDENYSGLAIIDFESWRPVFRQNFGTLSSYKNLSIAIERRIHPFWPTFLIEKEARRKFEFYAQLFMEETLYYAKRLRKKATWGFYAYPYCFNMSPANMNTHCSSEIVKENDSASWLFRATDNLHPSLYLSEGRLTAAEKLQMIEGRVDEANRVRTHLNLRNSTKIYPYFWFKYQDTKNFVSKQWTRTGFRNVNKHTGVPLEIANVTDPQKYGLSFFVKAKEDLLNAFLLLSASQIDGIVIWGSSNDVNNKSKCYELYDYIDDVLGPTIINTLW